MPKTAQQITEACLTSRRVFGKVLTLKESGNVWEPEPEPARLLSPVLGRIITLSTLPSIVPHLKIRFIHSR
jgi:hypothetical protein